MIQCNAELIQQLAQNLHHRDVLNILNFVCGLVLIVGIVLGAITLVSAWDKIPKFPLFVVLWIAILCAIILIIANFVVPTNSAIATIAGFCQMQLPALP